MNLYSNKQKWKIALLSIALFIISFFLFLSNSIVAKVREQERQRAKQWASTIKKRIELVQLTNHTFTQLREKEQEKMELWIRASKEIASSNTLIIPEFPMQIVKNNTNIPVILLDEQNNISGFRNIPFDTASLKVHQKNQTKEEIEKIFSDSLKNLANIWREKNPSFTIEVYPGMFMTYVYDDSREIKQLENERDSLFRAFNQELIDNERIVPILLLNQETREIIGTNMDTNLLRKKNISNFIQSMANNNDSIIIHFDHGMSNVLYFDSSPALKQLSYFPYIQFFIIGLFGIVGYVLFSTFRKAEQNQVWAGMAKETAHQLGTPISSLVAWIHLLEAQQIDAQIIAEMQKDINRLEKVSDRFSKIGSESVLEAYDLSKTVQNSVTYLQTRTSQQVKFQLSIPENIYAPHSSSLISWVIENVVKNAIDAMTGKGVLTIQLSQTHKWVLLHIQDTGKGMSAKQIRTIFKPGYTTKKRGWGLGLSLVKRIIYEYHKGKIVVISQPGNGAIFKINIPKKTPKKTAFFLDQ